EPICDFIVHTLSRSASVCHAKGAYSGKDKYIIFTALNRVQAVRLRNFIRQNDPQAFILISNTSELIGTGFHSVSEACAKRAEHGTIRRHLNPTRQETEKFT